MIMIIVSFLLILLLGFCGGCFGAILMWSFFWRKYDLEALEKMNIIPLKDRT